MPLIRTRLLHHILPTLRFLIPVLPYELLGLQDFHYLEWPLRNTRFSLVPALPSPPTAKSVTHEPSLFATCVGYTLLVWYSLDILDWAIWPVLSLARVALMGIDLVLRGGLYLTGDYPTQRKRTCYLFEVLRRRKDEQRAESDVD